MPDHQARSSHRRGLFAGLGCLAISIAPLLVFGVLQDVLGLFPANNGLGFGLWFAFTMPFAVIVLLLGLWRDLWIDARRERETRDNRQD